jgi:hypothetical protein
MTIKSGHNQQGQKLTQIDAFLAICLLYSVVN